MNFRYEFDFAEFFSSRGKVEILDFIPCGRSVEFGMQNSKNLDLNNIY